MSFFRDRQRVQGECKKKTGGSLMKELFEIAGTDLRVKIPSDLDHPVSDQIRKESDRIMESIYIRRMIFDFSETVFMDSSGIGLIMGRYRALGMKQGCILAEGANEHIQRLLRLSGVHRYMEIRESIEEGSKK